MKQIQQSAEASVEITAHQRLPLPEQAARGEGRAIRAEEEREVAGHADTLNEGKKGIVMNSEVTTKGRREQMLDRLDAAKIQVKGDRMSEGDVARTYRANLNEIEVRARLASDHPRHEERAQLEARLGKLVAERARS